MSPAAKVNSQVSRQRHYANLHGVPVLKHRLVAITLLALLVSGCAAGRAYRKGQVAARAGDWDEAVKEFTTAVQENPDNAQYKISLERAMQSAAREHISRAHELEVKDQLDGALIE